MTYTAYQTKLIQIKRRDRSVSARGRLSKKSILRNDTGNCLGVLVVDRDRLGPACELVDHRENRLETGAERKRALTADDVEYSNANGWSGGRRPNMPRGFGLKFVLRSHFTIVYISDDFATYAWLPEPLSDAVQSYLKAMMSRQA